MYKRSKTYKRRWNYLPAHRDFARRGYSRLDGKIDPFIFFPPSSLLFLVCIAREPVGIRTGSTDLGPLLLFFCSLGRQREEDLRFAQSLRVSSSSSPSPSLLSFSSQLVPVPSLRVFIRLSFPSVPLCFLSRLSSSFISVSPIDILFLQLFLRPFTVHLFYVTDTFIQGVPLSMRWISPMDSATSFLGDWFLWCDTRGKLIVGIL